MSEYQQNNPSKFSPAGTMRQHFIDAVNVADQKELRELLSGIEDLIQYQTEQMQEYRQLYLQLQGQYYTILNKITQDQNTLSEIVDQANQVSKNLQLFQGHLDRFYAQRDYVLSRMQNIW